MQGHRASIESLPDTFEIDHGSSSSNPRLDQQIYQNTMLNQVEARNGPNYLLPPGDLNMSCMDIDNQDNTSLSIWHPGGPSSNDHLLNQGRHDETKMEHNDTNMLSSEHVNINLNHDWVDDDQLFSQSADPNDARPNREHMASDIGSRNAVPESVLYPCSTSEIFKIEHDPSSSGYSDPYLNSSAAFMSEDGSESSLDGRRIACKRKTIEGFTGDSSSSMSASFPTNRNASTGINLSKSSEHIFDANNFEEQMNTSIMGGPSSEFYPSASLIGNAESSNRNFRMRMNPSRQQDSSSSLYAQGNTIRRSRAWSTNQPSSFIPYNQPMEQHQPQIPAIPCLPRSMHPFPMNGATNSRVGDSSNSTYQEERLVATRDDTNTMNITRNNYTENSLFVPTTDFSHLVQDPTNWSLANERAGTSSGVNPVVGPTWVSHQHPPTQYPRSSSEISGSFFSSDDSDSGSQSSNFPLRRFGFRGHQQQNTTSAFLEERQTDGVLGVPLSTRSLASARERRSRMMSEIRNALGLMRRGDNLRFEDVFVLDQSLFIGGAEFRDRHRDLRLDVDNMSYEELLALEERIGDVSTGLDEETIMKCLKQRKHSSARMESATGNEEQCCICREEYMEGEELGTLDCGHDFHTACIEQWLVRKNLCPICKTTALVT